MITEEEQKVIDSVYEQLMVGEHKRIYRDEVVVLMKIISDLRAENERLRGLNNEK